MIDPTVGNVYVIKLTDGSRTLARFTRKSEIRPYYTPSHYVYAGLHEYKTRTRYWFVNLKTNRDIVLKSRQKILKEVNTDNGKEG